MKNKINFSNVNSDGKFLLFTMMQAALKVKDMGKDEEYFLEFAKGIWETIEMNDIDQLKQTLNFSMMEDLKNYIK